MPQSRSVLFPTLAFFLLALPVPNAAAGDAKDPGPTRRFVRVPAPDGIQIRRYNQTDGAQPEPKDRVVIHYHGTLKDGSIFDSSVQRGRPAVLRLDKVIPCWTEALTRLHVGEKAQVMCPPAVAYGASGSPPAIPPNARLIFEIELIGIQ